MANPKIINSASGLSFKVHACVHQWATKHSDDGATHAECIFCGTRRVWHFSTKKRRAVEQ